VSQRVRWLKEGKQIVLRAKPWLFSVKREKLASLGAELRQEGWRSRDFPQAEFLAPFHPGEIVGTPTGFDTPK